MKNGVIHLKNSITMIKQMTSWVGKFILVIAFVTINGTLLSAQSWYSGDRLNFKNGRYHKTAGWVNSAGFSISPLIPFVVWYEISEGIGQTYPLQAEYIGYKLVKPKVGLGGGIALTMHPTGELGYESFKHIKFVDIYGYGKLYLNNKRRRSFVDTKVGFGYAIDNNISFGCYGCDQTSTLYLRNTSGLMLQPGIGWEFAKPRKRRWGMKLSSAFHFITQQRDRHENGWEVTDTGIIKSTTRIRTLGSLFFGFNFYL